MRKLIIVFMLLLCVSAFADVTFTTKIDTTVGAPANLYLWSVNIPHEARIDCFAWNGGYVVNSYVRGNMTQNIVSDPSGTVEINIENTQTEISFNGNNLITHNREGPIPHYGEISVYRTRWPLWWVTGIDTLNVISDERSISSGMNDMIPRTHIVLTYERQDRMPPWWEFVDSHLQPNDVYGNVILGVNW